MAQNTDTESIVREIKQVATKTLRKEYSINLDGPVPDNVVCIRYPTRRPPEVFGQWRAGCVPRVGRRVDEERLLSEITLKLPSEIGRTNA